eukprot:TRINITY_DN1841_c0_g1_i2.p1 TRINITY_DN1841_c0_g1~~TRINITY_DN1841_c0_g1_i2.p1  ORF type:complete len:120 (+),score=10.32 TRINITY_DN1841_c0_g1_i2:107-466(+)
MTSSKETNSLSVREYLLRRVGQVPQDAIGWLYACRGLYQLKEYGLVLEGLRPCLRNEKTQKEAQHLYAFALLHLKQIKEAAVQFRASVKLGNDTDWQPLVEILLDNKTLYVTPQTARRQ